MAFKAKLVALLSLGGGWEHVMTMISHLLLQALFQISVVDDGDVEIGQRQTS